MTRVAFYCISVAGLFILGGGCSVSVSEDHEAEWEDVGEICLEYCNQLVRCEDIPSSDEGACRDDCERAFEEDPGEAVLACQCVIHRSCASPETLVTACGDGALPGMQLEPIKENAAKEDDQHEDAPPGTAEGTAGTTANDADNAGGAPGTTDAGEAGAGGEVAEEAQAGSSGMGVGSEAEVDEEPIAESQPTGACARNHDCEANEDCIDGRCLLRCVASCQCPEGQACTEPGYCGEPEAPDPVVVCTDDCDCPSGLRCADGNCT